jgi:hypothetical protein
MTGIVYTLLCLKDVSDHLPNESIADRELRLVEIVGTFLKLRWLPGKEASHLGMRLADE